MAQHTENDYVIPTLFVLYNHLDGLPTEQVKAEINQFISLSSEDLLPYPSRNINEPRYYQIVGNMISHNNQTLFKYANRKSIIDPSGRKKIVLVINNEGIDFIENLIDEVKIDKKPSLNKEEIVDRFDQKIIEYATKNGTSASKRDNSLAKKIIEVSQYKCQYGLLTNKNHKLFKRIDGKLYAEAHHLIPMKASADFFPKNLDRASNLVCLCPNCHALLHHGSKDEKKEILKILYDKYIDVLNDDGIFISFDNLLNKYY